MAVLLTGQTLIQHMMHTERATGRALALWAFPTVVTSVNWAAS